LAQAILAQVTLAPEFGFLFVIDKKSPTYGGNPVNQWNQWRGHSPADQWRRSGSGTTRRSHPTGDINRKRQESIERENARAKWV